VSANSWWTVDVGGGGIERARFSIWFWLKGKNGVGFKCGFGLRDLGGKLWGGI